MKLAAADIDPHVGVRHHDVGIAGEPKPGDIEQRGQPLVRHRHVDMFEMDGVAEILGGAVELLLLHGRGFSTAFWPIIVKCEAYSSGVADPSAGPRPPRQVVGPQIDRNCRQAHHDADPENRRMMDRPTVAGLRFHSITSLARLPAYPPYLCTRLHATT